MTQATCRETGEWSVDEMSSSTNDKSPVPTCRPIMCPKLQAPENGAVSTDGPVAVGQVIIDHLLNETSDYVDLLKIVFCKLTYVGITSDYKHLCAIL